MGTRAPDLLDAPEMRRPSTLGSAHGPKQYLPPGSGRCIGRRSRAAAAAMSWNATVSSLPSPRAPKSCGVSQPVALSEICRNDFAMEGGRLIQEPAASAAMAAANPPPAKSSSRLESIPQHPALKFRLAPPRRRPDSRALMHNSDWSVTLRTPRPVIAGWDGLGSKRPARYRPDYR